MNYIIIFILLSTINGFLIKNFFHQHNSQLIRSLTLHNSGEIKKSIEYKLPLKQQKVINKINGFFGNIGPNVINNSSLYSLFSGNGNIQSIFFDKGNIFFTKHIIRTEKILFEEKYKIIPTNKVINLILTILDKLKLVPNILGTANTAFLNINKNLYALHERDKPYLLNIDYNEKTINTINKASNLTVEHFSAHSKFNNFIETIDYNIFSNTVSIYKLFENFTIINSINIKMDYLPIIHDFWSDKDKIIIINSPLSIDFYNFFVNPLPIHLDNTKNTIINIYDKKTNKINKYYSNESFFMFHFASVIEDKNYINIYASLYNKFDFNDMNIAGKYRKIVINKHTSEVTIEKNTILENYSLDFPIQFDNKILLRNMINNSFVICKDLKIIKEINLNGLSICGEPVLNYINKIPYIITFAFNTNNSFVLVININDNSIIKIPLDIKLTYGFHSIFISK